MQVPLFTIETNLEFPRVPVVLAPDVATAARAFDVDRIDGVVRIEKRNVGSRLFRIASGDRRLMLRAVDSAKAAATEVQCAVAAAVTDVSMIRPLPSRDGTFVTVLGESAWMAYEEVDGKVFSGTNADLCVVIGAVVRLFRALAEVSGRLSEAERAALPARTHLPERWPEFFEYLPDGRGGDRWDEIETALGTGGRSLLRDGQSVLGFALAAASRLPRPLPATVVHADLQHANLLVRDGRPVFLDVEDIILENPEVALAHAVFKIVRHAVYTRAEKCDRLAASTVPVVCAKLAAEGFAIRGSADLWAYGAFGILSDIHRNCCLWLEQGDGSLLFDVEKKVHNLFELQALTGETDGP